ncbi:Plant ubx domain-containing protein [Thalictrum thalictroides]|uniref:Plant ubx domain-containing protein n=1 Tax=Thalictrum thalictroides TaxID=46969 RepID=A0A7J6UUV1_THATH|nr:Plant ubx domain-containing protein [Thalictrum thalictroides]
MESVLTAEKQNMVSSFLEIAGVSAETASQFLQATSWQLEEAIQLFFVGNEGGVSASSSYLPPGGATMLPAEDSGAREKGIAHENVGHRDGSDGVRAPLPVKRDILYDDAILYRSSRMGYAPTDPSTLVPFRNFNEEMKRPDVWETGQNAASSAEASRDNLASLYRPPFALMHQGPFEKAKQAASAQDKWLLVNLQSNKEFSSHMLNRDTWANEAVAQTISTNFIFWQVYDDTTEGRKVCTYYKLESIPVVLVIDPITGQKMHLWKGMIEAESLLEDLLPYMDSGPKNNHVTLPHKRPREHKVQVSVDGTTEEDEDVLLALAASMENIKDPMEPTSTNRSESPIEEPETCKDKKLVYPPLPEEPKFDKARVCRLGFRLPDGRRLQRNFLWTDSIQLLWSFCRSQLEEAEVRPFRLAQAIPGVSTSLDYESNISLEESGLANSMISVTWD